MLPRSPTRRIPMVLICTCTTALAMAASVDTARAQTVSTEAELRHAVAVARWVIRKNYFHDVLKDPAFDGIAYGAFTKGNSIDTIMEGNVFSNCFISMSLGGGGTGVQYFRDGDTTYEERNGILRNN